jgi:putative FmdB family regulatory protein
MPVYEFYCPDCHMMFKFFSRRVNTETIPACPKCGRSELSRQLSMFAISKGMTEEDSSPFPSQVNESQMERALMSMASEVEGLDESDPRQAAQMMRKLSESMGLKLGDGFQEAMRRMEAGDDPDQIEAEMGDVLSESDLLAEGSARSLPPAPAHPTPPQVDETLYEL